MFLRQTPVGSVKDPATGEQQEKHVFVVFYAGERARTKVLKVRVVILCKVCTEGQHATLSN